MCSIGTKHSYVTSESKYSPIKMTLTQRRERAKEVSWFLVPPETALQKISSRTMPCPGEEPVDNSEGRVVDHSCLQPRVQHRLSIRNQPARCIRHLVQRNPRLNMRISRTCCQCCWRWRWTEGRRQKGAEVHWGSASRSPAAKGAWEVPIRHLPLQDLCPGLARRSIPAVRDRAVQCVQIRIRGV